MMNHTVTIEFKSLYPLSVDEWKDIERSLCAQIEDGEMAYTIHSVGITSKTLNEPRD